MRIALRIIRKLSAARRTNERIITITCNATQVQSDRCEEHVRYHPYGVALNPIHRNSVNPKAADGAFTLSAPPPALAQSPPCINITAGPVSGGRSVPAPVWPRASDRRQCKPWRRSPGVSASAFRAWCGPSSSCFAPGKDNFSQMNGSVGAPANSRLALSHAFSWPRSAPWTSRTKTGGR